MIVDDRLVHLPPERAGGGRVRRSTDGVVHGIVAPIHRQAHVAAQTLANPRRRLCCHVGLSWIGATIPWTVAAVLGALADREHAGCEVGEPVVDDDRRARLQAGRAREVTWGRIPTATTTRSQSSSPRPRTRSPCDPPRHPQISSVGVLSGPPPRALASPGASSAAAGASSWRSISRSTRWTTVVAHPRRASPCAASRPSRPPPMTAASPRASSRPPRAIASQSSGSRKT